MQKFRNTAAAPKLLTACLLVTLHCQIHAASVTVTPIDFEALLDPTAAAPHEQEYPGGGRYWAGIPPTTSGGTMRSHFESGQAVFNNVTRDFGGFTAWSGWAYSNVKDTTTPGFSNQYSAWTNAGAGGGAGGSSNYVIGFQSETPTITFAEPTIVVSAAIANTTYAALSMQDGDSFAKKFGGVSGDDPDFFLLTITGHNTDNTATGSIDFYLSDYRFSDHQQDYIIDAWTPVDLRALGVVASLSFTLASSDVGDFGINTPAYFALDNLAVTPVPLPPALATFALCLGTFLAWVLKAARVGNL